MFPALTIGGWLRYDIVNRMLKQIQPEVRSALEIGPGVGALGARLAGRFESYVGVELDANSFTTARARLERLGRGTVLHGDLSALPDHATFDLVAAFEVLEHYEDDRSVLRDWADHVRPGGWLMLSVPAFARRYKAWDELAGHMRRYERAQLRNLIVSTGLADPLIQTSGFPAGYLLELVRNGIARHREAPESMMERTRAIGHALQPADRLGIGILTKLLSWPFRLIQRPFANRELGTGFVALAQRPT